MAATIRRQEGESFGLNLGGPTTDADIATKGAGFYISKIAAGSPASKTKLKKGFQIIKIQGTDVSSLKFLKDVASVIKAAGNELRVTVVRQHHHTCCPSPAHTHTASGSQKIRRAAPAEAFTPNFSSPGRPL